MRASSPLPPCLLLLLLLAAPPAPADVFVLGNGQEVDGYRISETSRGEILIGNAAGTRRLSASVVKEVRPSADPAADFEAYWKGLPRRNAAAAAALGAWAKERGLPGKAADCFRRALESEPDNAAAREGLGHVKVEGEWLTAEEAADYRAGEALRGEIAARHGKAVGVKPEVVLVRHWTWVDFLEDGRGRERAKLLEEAFAAAKEVLGSDPWERRALAVACAGKEQYHRWIDVEGKTLPGMRGSFVEWARTATGLKWNEPPTLVRTDSPTVAAMVGAFLHTAGHLLVNNWNTLNREQPFWVEEGFGGWMEERILGVRTSHCFAVGAATGYGTIARNTKQWDVDSPDWKALVKEAARDNEFLPLDQLDSLPGGDYSNREVGQSFSLVAFLLEKEDHARFRDYLERVKGGMKSPVAFKQAYGRSFGEIEPAWKEFARTGW